MKNQKQAQNLRDIDQTRIAFVMDKLIPSEYSCLSEQELWAKRLLQYCPKQVWSWPFLINKQMAIKLYEKATITNLKCTPWGVAVLAEDTKQPEIEPGPEPKQNPISPPPF